MKLQLALHFLLLTILQLYHLLPPLPPPVSNTSCLFIRCQSLYASCCIGLLYFARYYTVKFKMLYFLCFCVCVKSILNLLQYSTTQPVVLVGYLGYLIGLTNSLSEQNPFVWRGLQFSSVTQSCAPLCDPMECSMPGLPVHHQLPEFTQTYVHQVGDATQPSHSLSSPSPPALNLSQHQGLFQ